MKPFPLDVLPTALRAAAEQFSSRHWVSPGAATMAILSVTGAAVGARVRVRYRQRERSLCLPVALVSTPCSATSDGLDALVHPFAEERARLTSLRPCYSELGVFDPEAELAKVLQIAPDDLALVARLHSQVQELKATQAPGLVTVNRPGTVDQVFDAHQLLYGRAGEFSSKFVAAEAQTQAHWATVLRQGFYGITAPGTEPYVVTPLVETTAALARDILAAWRTKAPHWPMIWVEARRELGALNTDSYEAVTAVLAVIKAQLRLRSTHPSTTLVTCEHGNRAVENLYQSMSALGAEIRAPYCYEFMPDVLVRVAAILHVGWSQNPGDAIPAETWDVALSLAHWLLDCQHAFVVGPAAHALATPAVPARRYPAPKPDDDKVLWRHLYRNQPTHWRELTHRLPKRQPGYWSPLRDILIQNGHLEYSGDRLITVRPL